MLIGKEELCSLIPHAGKMCLLENVMSWNEKEIRCEAVSHIAPSNPLRRNGLLSSIHLLEYGAQAMAVHGGLLARASGNRTFPGYLAALRDVVLHQEFIEGIKTPLIVHAQQIASFTDSFMYRFSVATGNNSLASARATVIAQKNTTR
jgi:predicted hotdog family 3-hydroxylacyl-ACP dehydratase